MTILKMATMPVLLCLAYYIETTYGPVHDWANVVALLIGFVAMGWISDWQTIGTTREHE